MRILITGDWQARFSNLDYCRIAHDQEMEIIAKENVQVHIDLGDQKDDYNPIDFRVTDFVMTRAAQVSNAVDFSIRLLGNHDRIGQHDDSNNWMTLFRNMEGHSVDKPLVLKHQNVAFACLPFRKKWASTKKAALKLRKEIKHELFAECDTSILLFHNDIAGSKYDTIQGRESSSKITLGSLRTKLYTQCFGGHIHLRQQLSKNTWFAGNPFATDMGEVDQLKGFLLYDTDTKKVKVISSKVPGIFSWPYLQKHRPKSLPDGTKIRAVVNCDNSKNYYKQLDAVSSEIEKRYPTAISYVLPKFTASAEKQEVVVDPTSSDYDKVLSYIEASAPADLLPRKKQLASFMSSILLTVSGKALSRANGKLDFERIYARNVLSFSKLDYDLRHRGLVVVKGKNIDWPNHSNGSGKSNFLSIIPIVLSNQTFKGQKNDAWASDQNEDKAIAKLWMRNDRGQVLKVTRGRRPAKLMMSIDGKDESSGLRSSGKKETQGQVEEFTGYNFATLANSVYIDQRMSNAFLTGTPTDRSNLIHSFQNLERFVVARKEVSSQLSQLTKNLDIVENTVSVSVELISDIEDEIKATQRSVKKSISKLRKAKLLAAFKLKKVTAATTKRLVVLRSRYAELEKEETKLEEAIATVSSQIVANENYIGEKQDELASLLDLKGEKTCGVCFQPLTPKALAKAKTHVESLIQTKKKANDPIESKRVRFKQKLQEARKAIQYVNSKIADMETPVAKAQRELDDCAASLKSAQELTAESASTGTQTHEKRNKLKRDMVRATRTIQHYKDEKKFLEYAVHAFSRDGLPAFLCNLLIPTLNKASARYSKIFIDSEIQVIFEIEKGQIVPKIINAHGGKSLQAQSMGENAWAGLITSFALREIAHPSNLLILDEPGNGLDSESCKLFGQRLPRLKSQFETILVVTHNQHIASALESQNTLTVVKQHKRSTLVESPSK